MERREALAMVWIGLFAVLIVLVVVTCGPDLGPFETATLVQACQLKFAVYASIGTGVIALLWRPGAGPAPTATDDAPRS